MTKWKPTAFLRDPFQTSPNDVLDAVRWTLEDGLDTKHLTILGLTIEPDESAGSGRKLPPYYVEPDCDPTTGVCHYGKLD